MQSNIKLIRAIGSEFIRRKLRAFYALFAVGAMMALAVSTWLTTLNIWWWLLATAVIIGTLAGILVCVVSGFAVRILRPHLTKAQIRAVGNFVDKLERVAEHVQTPMLIIVLRVIRDILWPRQPNFISSIIQDSASLRPDFKTLQEEFKS